MTTDEQIKNAIAEVLREVSKTPEPSGSYDTEAYWVAVMDFQNLIGEAAQKRGIVL